MSRHCSRESQDAPDHAMTHSALDVLPTSRNPLEDNSSSPPDQTHRSCTSRALLVATEPQLGSLRRHGSMHPKWWIDSFLICHFVFLVAVRNTRERSTIPIPH
jgi:hypothetical protein